MSNKTNINDNTDITNKIDKIEERYIATLILHAVGDTIGFKNGEWEFKFGSGKIVSLSTTLEILYEFIALGGINDINLENWHVSDDTIMHMTIAYALVDINTTDDKLFNEIHHNYMAAYEVMKRDQKKGIKRYMGIITKKYLESMIGIAPLGNKQDGRTLPYDPLSGGNGAAMRTHSIGLAYFGEENRDKLIDIAVVSSQMTHNSPIGWLGGLVSALFTAFAIENIPISKWFLKMMEIVESDKVTKYIRPEYEEEQQDYHEFVKFCKTYIDDRFENGEPIKTRANMNLIYRSRYYFEKFTTGTKGRMAGDSGYSSIIMAYDCLLDCNGNWETLIIYAALHWGDGDTVAAIACGWFGAVYGMKNIPEANTKYLEYKNYLYGLGKDLYRKYYMRENLTFKYSAENKTN